MKTLLLDNTLWDLCLDAGGNIAVASEPYALAQDVASAIRLFLGELWYDDSKGVPYFQQVLGHAPPVQLLQDYMIAAAKSVPGVVSASCIIESFKDRTVSGSVVFKDSTGTSTTVALS